MRKNKLTITITCLITVVIGSMVTLSSCSKERDIVTFEYIDKIKLGKFIFNDKNLSTPIGQSCSSCHNPSTGFSDPNHSIISEGAVNGLFGNRNTPNIAYSMFTPALYFDNVDSTYVGGFFLDGRANSLKEQAHEPFLNPLEMNIPNVQTLINKIKAASYYPLYKQVYGEVLDNNIAFNNVADAIALFEKSPDLNPFTSKYDYYLKGQAKLNAQELRGLQLFNDSAKSKCANCHISEPDPISGKVLFTDFTYDNIGVPKNPANPFYTLPTTFNPLGNNAIDYGLGGFLNNPTHYGKFKVPTLRNSAISAPYFHNGFYNTLEEVVHFYNKRDVEPFPPAEITATVNRTEVGNLHLTAQEEKDIVAFIKTLTDGFK
ncbi:cytochrome-c peroxidase [Parasediminibacterium paludis]|uniref:Cytochrome-c peroxidase n=1 Tax=Parasediminibacterium paludis TaxID=908966 RepID=A0ABV8PUU7_9BACT